MIFEESAILYDTLLTSFRDRTTNFITQINIKMCEGILYRFF